MPRCLNPGLSAGASSPPPISSVCHCECLSRTPINSLCLDCLASLWLGRWLQMSQSFGAVCVGTSSEVVDPRIVSARLEPRLVVSILCHPKLRSGNMDFLLWPTQVAVGLGGELKPLSSASNLHPSPKSFYLGGGHLLLLCLTISPS